jgi:tRNA A58 N-methylase Trm61
VPTFTMGVPAGGLAPPALGHPMVEEAQREQAAALLQHTYRWLDEAVVDVPQLADAIPAVVAAVQLYQAGQYSPCLNQITAVVGSLQQARGAFPALPPL